MDRDLTKQVLAALEEAGARYVVFGLRDRVARCERDIDEIKHRIG
jgi:hypothetical protein